MSLLYTRATSDDADAMSALLRQTSEEFITRDFAPEDASRFLEGNGADMLRETIAGGGFYFVARDGDEIAGMIGVVSRTHVKYLFVGGRWHRRGIARELLALAIAEMQARAPVVAVSVNASDYALVAYNRLGFVPVDARLVRDGVAYTPMRKVLAA